MDKKIKIEIKHYLSGAVLFEYECVGNTIKTTLENAGDANLRDANLYGADLRDANLRAANLYGADLRDANLRGANLRDANLRGANLRDANLRDANLYGADLRDANLRDADLYGADLRDANLRDAENILPIYANSLLSLLRAQKNPLRGFKYLSDDMSSPIQSLDKITYEVGESVEVKDYNDSDFDDCGSGINLATLEWCLREGSIGNNVFIEVEFLPEDIVAIPYGTDGKFRVRKCTVIRKIPKTELKKYMKVINPTKEEK